MLFGEAIGIAVQSLRANKLRSLLTVLGILIGVSSVIAVVAITEGLDGYMSDKVLELGTKAFRLQQRPDIITSNIQWLEMMKRKRLTMDDMEAVQEGLHAVLGGGRPGRGPAAASSAAARSRRTSGSRGSPRTSPASASVRELLAGRHIVQRRHRGGLARGRDRDGPVRRLLRHDGAARQGDRRRRPHAEGDRRRREEGRRVRREPGQLPVDPDHDLLQALRLAPLVQRLQTEAASMASSRRRRTRCGWRCARAAT